MILTKVGKKRLKYNQNTGTAMMTLNEYMQMAKRIIGKYANKEYAGLSKRMLADDDAIAAVAHEIMMGDWVYCPDRGMSVSSYRIQRGIWAIKDYVSFSHNKKNIPLVSLNKLVSFKNNGYSRELGDHLPDSKGLLPEDVLGSSSVAIDNILNTVKLTKKQRKCLRMYYLDNQTMQEIGQELGITRQAAFQLIKLGLKKLQNNKDIYEKN